MVTIAAQIAGRFDGVPLRAQLQRVARRRKLTAFTLVLPLLLFILIAFALRLAGDLDAVYDDTHFSPTMTALSVGTARTCPTRTPMPFSEDIKQACRSLA
ncbi:hypothetical protein [Bradyrhizobium icense]|uniref:Uncharacterized protein n=1 Tax=Bradyrhizobium icense TaxID=1274631 RepID=A0A1B1UJU9_9BRAD|nr:hypothetical protein [Bradyrhizobium icense]ANW03014.1 hypothetical protein LMTR13_25525 [Bradyrhizobium icense]